MQTGQVNMEHGIGSGHTVGAVGVVVVAVPGPFRFCLSTTNKSGSLFQLRKALTHQQTRRENAEYVGLVVVNVDIQPRMGEQAGKDEGHRQKLETSENQNKLPRGCHSNC